MRNKIYKIKESFDEDMIWYGSQFCEKFEGRDNSIRRPLLVGKPKGIANYANVRYLGALQPMAEPQIQAFEFWERFFGDYIKLKTSCLM